MQNFVGLLAYRTVFPDVGDTLETVQSAISDALPNGYTAAVNWVDEQNESAGWSVEVLDDTSTSVFGPATLTTDDYFHANSLDKAIAILPKGGAEPPNTFIYYEDGH